MAMYKNCLNIVKIEAKIEISQTFLKYARIFYMKFYIGTSSTQ